VLPSDGVPESVAVPSPLSTKVSPAGNGPSSARVACGSLEVTVKEPAGTC
jgi:hypothetical protein